MPRTESGERLERVGLLNQNGAPNRIAEQEDMIWQLAAEAKTHSSPAIVKIGIGASICAISGALLDTAGTLMSWVIDNDSFNQLINSNQTQSCLVPPLVSPLTKEAAVEGLTIACKNEMDVSCNSSVLNTTCADFERLLPAITLEGEEFGWDALAGVMGVSILAIMLVLRRRLLKRFAETDLALHRKAVAQFPNADLYESLSAATMLKKIYASYPEHQPKPNVVVTAATSIGHAFCGLFSGKKASAPAHRGASVNADNSSYQSALDAGL